MLLATIEEAGKQLSPSKRLKKKDEETAEREETNNAADSTPVSSKRSTPSPVEAAGVKKHRTETTRLRLADSQK